MSDIVDTWCILHTVMQSIQLHGINPVIPFYVQCGGYLLWWMSYNRTGFRSRRSRGWGLSHHHCHQNRHHHHDHAHQWQEQQKHQQKQQGVDETRGRLLWEPRETKRTIFLANPCNHQHHHRHHKKLKETSPIIIIIITRPWPAFGRPGLEWIIGW